ncbi:MAG TPA: hypothetical protein VHE13_09805 [Opitutus sp.]|nr:hypothetical protein [Opitutus sp.]
MDPDRLAELHRQRAIVRDHLAWLENEIAASTGQPPPGRPAPPPAPAPVPPGEFHDPAPNAAGTADSARRGCLFATFVLLLVGAIALTAIYFVRYRDRPVIFMSHDQPPPSRK